MIETRRPSAADDLLTASRRIDWRFLLSPEFGTVAIGDGADPALADALHRFSSSVTTVRDFGTALAQYDLIVLVDPSRDEVAAAARALAAGGWLYVQVSALRPRPLRRPRLLPAYVRALRRAGLDDVAGYWHFPDLVSCEEIVPIASTGALKFSFGRRRTAPLARAKARLAVLLAKTRLLGYFVAHGSVVGRRTHAR
jgi:hypothetical protein